MERRDWWVYPWQIDSIVAGWQRRYPAYVQVACQEQYTRQRVWAITVTDKSVSDQDKQRQLFFVPHAHEPAGTAASMSFVEQLLSGNHADGTPSTLRAQEILKQAVLTFIPDGNPYGRARCPEPVWIGDKYNNREFINMVFGIGDLRSHDPLKPRWERFKRVDSFTIGEEAPARVGLVYEQVSADTYVEPNRGDPRSAMAQLVARLTQEGDYDQVLALHQTEFEGYANDENCMVMLPALQAELPQARQASNLALAEVINGVWGQVGGIATPVRAGRGESSRFQRQALSIPWEAQQRAGAFLTLEIQNNNLQTPAEQQMLLFDAAIWRSIAFMLGET